QTREKDPLEQVLYASYEVLNQMNPNLTEHCWLCYDIRPPYYEAIGISNKAHLSSQTNPPQCLWSSENPLKQGMTISQVTGQGR
ncbi:ENV2 protein, partial [Scytalopus superciliaris]|nr:ENV2 protein [Scytalopus superciliaris]